MICHGSCTKLKADEQTPSMSPLIYGPKYEEIPTNKQVTQINSDKFVIVERNEKPLIIRIRFISDIL